MQHGISIVEAVPSSDGNRTIERAAKAVVVIWRVLRLPVMVVVWSALWVAGTASRLVKRLYIYFCVQADASAKCPACGVRAEHDMRWSDTLTRLVHVCKRCMAVWSEQPVRAFADWQTSLQANVEAEAGEQAVVNRDGTRTTTVQNAQREPQIVNSVKMTGSDRPIVLRMGGRQ